jgi:dolichyl-phosphate beta-glucosyltransferase
MTSMISIVIAAFNEEKRIGQSLGKIHDYLRERQCDYEIIVVDDGSSDRTAALVRELSGSFPGLRSISYKKNRGKGYALRAGVLASRGSLVLVSDADLSTPIEELDTLIGRLPQFDLAIGSRALAQSEILAKQPWWRQGMGKIFNLIVKLVVIDQFSDTQCGFKLFAGETARDLFGKAQIDRFAYDVEILALAREEGYRTAEVPVRWINDPASTVDPVRDSLRMLFDLVRIRLNVAILRAGKGRLAPESLEQVPGVGAAKVGPESS